MNKVNFEDIYVLANVEEETEDYIHYHYPRMLSRYDSNFIAFKKMPSLLDFLDIATYLKDFHQKKKQLYVNFHFPENCILPTGLERYLLDRGYEISCIELYAIKPGNFPRIEINEKIKVRAVDVHHLSQLLKLQHIDNRQFGRRFVKEQEALTKRQFDKSSIEYVLAFYKGVAVGYVELIISDRMVEINDLTVLEKYRHKSIGSRIQQYVMDKYDDKIIILITDGHDTPRNMYRKQKYQYCGFRYEAIKI